MTRTFTIISTLVFTLLCSAAAQAEPVANNTALGQCVADCEAQLKLICFDESNRDITVMCSAVNSCKDLSAGDKAAASALFGACYQGTINNCPANCPPGGGTATVPPTQNGPPKQARRAPPPKKDACKAAGGFYLTEPGGTEKFCYTHQSMYEHLRAVEDRLAELERKAKSHVEQGEPVPFDLQRDYESEKQLLMEIDRSLVDMNDQLRAMSNRLIDYANHFNQRISALEGRMDQVESMASATMGEVKTLRDEKSAGIAPALVGWSINPYFTVQAFDLYGEAQYAGGLELGLYPSLSTNGRHRVALNLGFGKAANYFEKSMVQHHLFGGYGYFAEAGSLAVGLGVNRYSLTNVQQGRLFWIGPEVEGKLNIADLGADQDPVHGSYLFLSGRVGAGYRYGRHGILDPKYEPVTGRFDMPFTLGIGIQNVPFL